MLFKTDSIGNQLWDTTVVTAGADYSGDLNYSNDGNLIWLATLRSGSTIFDPLANTIRKFDYNGNVLWFKSYQNYNNGGAVNIVKGLNGGYIYAGVTDNTTNDIRAFIHRLDENGDSLWYREFNSPMYDDFWDIKTTTDGGYIMCGQTGDCANNGGTCFWLVKTDSLGLLTTGIKNAPDFSAAKLSTVYPNPCNQSFSVTAVVPQTQQQDYGKKGAFLLLFDVTGKQLQELPLTIGVNTVQVQMSAYTQGTYLCVLAIDGYNVAHTKVVKY